MSDGWLLRCACGEETFGWVKDGPPDKFCSVCGAELKGPAKAIEIPEGIPVSKLPKPEAPR